MEKISQTEISIPVSVKLDELIFQRDRIIRDLEANEGWVIDQNEKLDLLNEQIAQARLLNVKTQDEIENEKIIKE